MLIKKKGNIFSVQHGGNYGDIYLQRGSMEYGADKFISWGQKKLPNFDINFDPLPSPQLRMSYKKNNSEKIPSFKKFFGEVDMPTTKIKN